MNAVELVFAVGWGAFWLYWLVAAFSMTRGHVPWGRELRIRVVVVLIVWALVRLGVFRAAVFRNDNMSTHPVWSAIGIALLALGLGFAVWARLHIGRNWGSPMTEKEDPELITSGPYHLVRHPIYSGLILAGIGTAVTLGWQWLIAVALMGPYFIYSATVEERYMATRFPETYPDYKRSTKMLLPFIF